MYAIITEMYWVTCVFVAFMINTYGVQYNDKAEVSNTLPTIHFMRLSP